MMLGLLVAFVAVVALGSAVIYLGFERHRDRYQLDHYGRPPGVKPLSSFVCPECLHRSYAPKHIEARYCMKCDKSFLPASEEIR